ncbi:MAG TPA: helix-turn-helix domain-containing protein [Thermoplasmata archaeon]|nr:helix-turn-helix domain-containing protein [Thermoplasmata archaeon]
MDVVGKKWGICVVTLVGRHGQLRFGPIQRALPRVSPATLSSTLRALESEGILQRLPVPDDRRALAAYALTEAGGQLYENLLPLASWLRQRHDREVHPEPRTPDLSPRPAAGKGGSQPGAAARAGR